MQFSKTSTTQNRRTGIFGKRYNVHEDRPHPSGRRNALPSPNLTIQRSRSAPESVSFMARTFMKRLQFNRVYSISVGGAPRVQPRAQGMRKMCPHLISVHTVLSYDLRPGVLCDFSAIFLRKGSLALEDMAGGSFTISNGGVFGSLMGTPIINPPQSAILGMHATKMRAVVGPDVSS